MDIPGLFCIAWVDDSEWDPVRVSKRDVEWQINLDDVVVVP
jgi:hypothetical protein